MFNEVFGFNKVRGSAPLLHESALIPVVWESHRNVAVKLFLCRGRGRLDIVNVSQCLISVVWP